MFVKPTFILLAAILYPADLNISSNGITKDLQKHILGEYQMMDCVSSSGRPVWQKGSSSRYLYFRKKKWWFGPDHAKAFGYEFSLETGLSEIPQNGWAVYNGTNWLSDPEFIVLIASTPNKTMICTIGCH